MKKGWEREACPISKKPPTKKVKNPQRSRKITMKMYASGDEK
jgi:hypothetical protein